VEDALVLNLDGGTFQECKDNRLALIAIMAALALLGSIAVTVVPIAILAAAENVKKEWRVVLLKRVGRIFFHP
jgi:hypothetical protein